FNPADIFVCSGEDEPEFDLTENDPNVLGDQDPDDFTIKYYESETNAEDGDNAIADPEHYDYPDPDAESVTIWVRMESIKDDGEASGCYQIGSFEISYGSLEVGELDDLEECDP